MSRRPSQAFILCLVPLLMIGSGAGWAWWKVNSIPQGARAKLTLWEQLRYQKPKEFTLPTKEQLMASRDKVDVYLTGLTTQFPDLKIQEHPVPDEQNGFLLVQNLGGPDQAGLPIDEHFKTLLDGKSWDRADAERSLADHAEVVAKVNRIAALKTRSSTNMPPDYAGFASARPGKQAADILLLQARLAAEAGDEALALQHTAGALNIAAHYREIETPNLLTETVAVLIDLHVRKQILDHQLPALGAKADLEKWKALLETRHYTPADFARVMRGEWNTVARYFLLPPLVDEHYPCRPPDPDAIARTFTERYSAAVTRLPTLTLEQLRSGSVLPAPSPPPVLSEEGQLLIDTLQVGNQSWQKGYVRAAAVIAQYRTALEIMGDERHEKSPATGTLTGLTRDPFSGDAFEFDAATRTLTAPAAAKDLEVEPLVLP